MGDSREYALLKKIRERASLGKVTDEMQIRYRIFGGLPQERIDEELTLSGKGEIRNTIRSSRLYAAPQSVSGTVKKEEAAGIFRDLTEDTPGLFTREEARFLPDSVVGEVTLTMGGETAVFYFLPDERERELQKKSLSPGASKAISRIQGMVKQFSRPREGIGDA